MDSKSLIEDYLLSCGYENDKKCRVLGEATTFTKGGLKIFYDTLFKTTFKIYNNDVKVFDIDEVTRKVFLLKFGSNEYIRTGIAHHISIEEVKGALRKLNIDSLLDEGE